MENTDSVGAVAAAFLRQHALLSLAAARVLLN
jgi:hypothetical protein